MRFRCVLALMAALLGAVAAPDVRAADYTARIREQRYVRLTEWARWQGLDVRWTRHDDTLRLSKSNVRLDFTVDSREAGFNGVQLWLVLPAATRNGDVYLSQLDIDTTLKPLLSPPRNDRGKKVRVVCLDAGHGGKDPGNRAGGRQEKDYALRLTLEVSEQFRKAGFKVVLTRGADRFLELSERAAIARRGGADVFLSLHFNGSGSTEARGTEVYALTPAGAASTNARGEGANAGAFPGNRSDEKNLLLAYQLQQSLVSQLGSQDRGVRRARFEVLREATMPAALVEAGFLSHPAEGGQIATAEYRRHVARAMVTGVQAYKKMVER